MARDYKNTPRNAEPRRTPGWAWMLGGLSVGLFVAFLVYLKEHSPATPLPAAPAPVVKGVPAPAPAPSARAGTDKAPAKPRFEFYKILPEMEIAVPESQLPARERHGDEANGQAYLLQVGSFRGFAEADRLKATLAFQGLDARIETVTVNGHDTWHRVRIGPISGLAAVEDVRQRLKSHELDAIVLKVR